MKRHQIDIMFGRPGKCWGACSTCGLKSKQGSVRQAVAWMVKHQDEAMKAPAKKKVRR